MRIEIVLWVLGVCAIGGTGYYIKSRYVDSDPAIRQRQIERRVFRHEMQPDTGRGGNVIR